MNWEAIGAIAEVPGALGVIATLAYLSLQIRRNSTLLSSTAAGASRDGYLEISRILSENGEANRIFWDGLESRECLSVQDKRRFDPIISINMQIWEHDFEIGRPEQSVRWDWLLQKRGFAEWWQEHRLIYPNSFRQCIDDRLAACATAAQQATVGGSDR